VWRCRSLASDWLTEPPRFSFIGNPGGRPVQNGVEEYVGPFVLGVEEGGVS
jgi:hypothetical protein